MLLLLQAILGSMVNAFMVSTGTTEDHLKCMKESFPDLQLLETVTLCLIP